MTRDDYPRRIVCAGCMVSVDYTRAFFLLLGRPQPIPLCAECARAHVEAFTPIACILEAQLVIRSEHERLNRYAVQQ